MQKKLLDANSPQQNYAARNLERLKNNPLAYGGVLFNTRRGRSRPRPLALRHSMHLVLRASQARGEWSFKRKHNEAKIRAIIQKFSQRHVVKILTLAIVGNHIHFHIKLSKLAHYPRFIRALTAAIAIAVAGHARWQKTAGNKKKFWDHRPFTRIVVGARAVQRLVDYICINQLEGFGNTKQEARFYHAMNSS